MLYFGGENDRYRITAYYYYANTVPDSYAFTGTSLLWESIAKIGISEAAISQHLQILKDCGIVTGQRIDRQMHYQVNTELLIQSVGVFHQEVLEKSEHMPNRDYCDCELAEFCSRKGDVKK